eukprot:6190797-Pleurochrysis_carterae.AAC.1
MKKLESKWPDPSQLCCTRILSTANARTDFHSPDIVGRAAVNRSVAESLKHIGKSLTFSMIAVRGVSSGTARTSWLR